MKTFRLVVLTLLLAAWPGLPLLADQGLADRSAGSGAGERAHFHHVRLNVADPQASIDFYRRVLGAVPIQFNNRAPALFTERSFILFNQVDEPVLSNLATTIWHIGWSHTDGPGHYRWLQGQDVEFHQHVTELGPWHYMYFYGPDRELIEVYTGSQNHRFEHVHLLSTDVQATKEWFAEHLNLYLDEGFQIPRGPTMRIDNLNLIIFPNDERYERPEAEGEMKPTELSTIAHIAFSFRDLDAAFARVSSNGVEIVSPPAINEPHGLNSFFVRGPDNLLVEFVQARPIPEAGWE